MRQILPLVSLFAFGLFFASCQKDEQVSPTRGDTALTSRSHDCETVCIDTADPDAYAHMGSVAQTAGPNSWTFNFSVYNTPTGFELGWQYAGTSNASKTLIFTVSGGGFSAAMTHTTAVVQTAGSGSHTFNFNTAWEACDVVNFTARIGDEVGSPIGSVSATMGSYDLVAECASECPECFVSETGWSDGDEYAEGGNWATYTAYAADNTVTLYAGQTYDAGTVHFSAVNGGMVTITIALADCWEFDDVSENVKIQGYSSAPMEEPGSIGSFANKSTAVSSPYSVDVPAANYYGVHVDLLRPVECPE